jgi:hypothetical protein
MGYTKPKETTRWHLENAPLPNHGKSYTVISHQEVIENTYKLLNDSGFMVSREMYRSSKDANIAQGVYHIYPVAATDNDIIIEKELGMMFAWTNSYDKTKSFASAIGADVAVCHNGMIAGDMMNYKRKHRWSASHDIHIHMSDQIKSSEKYYKRLIKDKDLLKNIKVNEREAAELAGRLFIEENIIDSQQLSCLKQEIKKASYNYGVADDSAWAFYNHVTHALKKTHPRDWVNSQQNFHDFITVELIGSPATKTMFEKPTEYVDMGQIDVEVDIQEQIVMDF